MKNIRLVPFIKTAKVWAEESTCTRLHVGAAIFNKRTKRVLAVGYNGTIAGQKHCNELFDYNNLLVHVDLQDYLKCELPNKSGWNKVSENTFKELHHEFSEKYEVHAEQNAIYNLFKTGTDWQQEDMAIVTTTEPCCQCSKAIAALGIKECYYIEPYDRSNGSISWFFEHIGVKYERASI